MKFSSLHSIAEEQSSAGNTNRTPQTNYRLPPGVIPMTNKKYSGDSFVEFSGSRGTEESVTVTDDILNDSGLSSP